MSINFAYISLTPFQCASVQYLTIERPKLEYLIIELLFGCVTLIPTEVALFLKYIIGVILLMWLQACNSLLFAPPFIMKVSHPYRLS